MTHVRPMTAADLSLGLRLSAQAGWNQTEADWRRFLALQSDGCFVAEWDGTPAGTTTTAVFGPVAWVAMVLVDEPLRGRGIAKRLLARALDFLDRRGVATVRLDATPLGLPLYRRLGFVEQFRLMRYEGTPVAAADGSEVTVAAPGEWEALAALDEGVTGTARRPLLFRLFGEHPDWVLVVRDGGRPIGFLAARPGRLAVHLGPGIASPIAGPHLFADAWRRHAGRRVFLDVPEPNEPAAQLTEAQGLTVQRHLTRMTRGVPMVERVEWLWASSGPEKG
jgi:GNAT superfamily N-acetyltransferase